jgi:hypothetical protein
MRNASKPLWWVALVVVVGLVLSGCAAATGSAVTAIPAGQLGGLFTAASVPSAEHVLAADGIATVKDEKSTTPLVAVTGSVRMTFTLAQVHAMTLQAADHGGLSGAALDEAAPLPANYPPFAYILASWISTSTTPAAKAMRGMLGTQKWSDAPQLVFPTIALPLFAADVINATPAATPSPKADGPTATEGLSAVEAVSVHGSLLTAPCSTVSNFIQGVLGSVFSALQVNSSSSGGIGGFFRGIWNGAVSLAAGAIQGLISALTGPVLNAIKTIAGTAVVIAQVASYLNPWSVKVTADPSSVSAGDGGTFSAAVDTGTGTLSYPGAITDCAQAFGNLTLPPLSGANADAVWKISGAVSTTDSTTVTLDGQGKASLSFASAVSDSAACGSDAPADQTGVAQITVTRPGIENLKTLATSMLSNGLGIAGSILSPILTSILSPIINQVLSKISSLVDVIGSGTVTITGTKGADCGNSSSSTNNPSSSSSPSKTRKVVWACPSVAVVASVLNDPSLGQEGTTLDTPGQILDCVYTATDNTGTCGQTTCVAEVVFIGGATDDASNFSTPGNHVIPGANCDCDIAAYNNTPSSAFAADNALTVLGVVNTVQVGVTYPVAVGTAPGLALLRIIFSK